MFYSNLKYDVNKKMQEFKTREADDLQVSQEQQLRDLYHSPETGYRNLETMLSRANDEGIHVSRKQMKDFLARQEEFQKFRQRKNPSKFRKTYARDLGYQIQMDLIDLKNISAHNDGYFWILAAIDVLSRYAFCYPLKRKTGENIVEVLKKFLNNFQERFHKPKPLHIQFDKGSEFNNKEVKKFFTEKDINTFSTKTLKKAAIVERFNRTLKTIMFKFFYHSEQKNWTRSLNFLVANYNAAINRGIGMAPKDVSDENKHLVYLKLYGTEVGELEKPTFKIGDRVRIRKYYFLKRQDKNKEVFKKGYIQKMTDEEFNISRVMLGDPVTYKISDDEHEIFGIFYKEELVKVPP